MTTISRFRPFCHLMDHHCLRHQQAQLLSTSIPEKAVPCPDLVGLGFCGWDTICLVPEIPSNGKVEIEQTLMQGGGPAATAIYAAQKLGSSAAFLGVVGDDENGDNILREFRERGVDTGGMIRRLNATSPMAICWTESQKGHRSIAWSKGTGAPLKPEEVCLDKVLSSRVLHLDGHQTEAALYAAKAARSAGVTTCLDAGTLLEGMDALLGFTDIVIASEDFARAFTRQTSLEFALRHLLMEGPRWAVITCGEQGSLGYDGTRFYKVPAFTVRVVDTTGAGDVFHGAFLHAYLQGGDFGENLKFASAAAALKCEQLGGRTGIPSPKRLTAFLHEQSTRSKTCF